MAVFSVTDRANYRRCRRKWDWSSNARQNLTGIGAGPEPLELGSLVHRVLADWIVYYTKDMDSANNPGFAKTLFLSHSSIRQQEIIEAFEVVEGRTPPDELLAPLHNVVDLGMAMMDNYQRYHQTPLPTHMRFASPEQEVLIPVPGTEHICQSCVDWHEQNNVVKFVTREEFGGRNYLKLTTARLSCKECSGKGWSYHYLSATLDGLLQDNKDYLYVLEHKTYEQRPKKIDLFMNDQFTGYCWVVRELKVGKVAGVAYDGMWKRPAPPKYMQRERRAGRMEDLFIRLVISKSDDELDEWGRNLALEINEMANNPAIYPNVPWQGCTDCQFIEPCRMTMLGEDPTDLLRTRYTQREIVRGGNIDANVGLETK